MYEGESTVNRVCNIHNSCRMQTISTHCWPWNKCYCEIPWQLQGMYNMQTNFSNKEYTKCQLYHRQHHSVGLRCIPNMMPCHLQFVSFSAIKLQPKQSHYSPASKQETTMMHSKAACMWNTRRRTIDTSKEKVRNIRRTLIYNESMHRTLQQTSQSASQNAT